MFRYFLIKVNFLFKLKLNRYEKTTFLPACFIYYNLK